MRLLLSSEAVPAGTPADLVRACRRRALAGLELAATEALGGQAMSGLRVPVPWLRLDDEVEPDAATHVARQLEASLLLTAPLDPPPVGIPLAIVHGAEPAEVGRAVEWAQVVGAGTAWEVQPGELTPDRLMDVLALTRPTLVHVRLLGAGPEAGDDVTADLMVRLALGGYAGTVTLAPSAAADLNAWARWLFTTRSWGCGTAHERRVRARPTPTA